MPSSEIMGDFKRGTLHSGRGKGGKKGKIVKSRQQALAIMESYRRKEGKTGRKSSRR